MCLNIDNIGKWNELDFFKNGCYHCIKKELEAKNNWRPDPYLVFRALKLTQPDDVKVIFLGQDPYPKKTNPDGLAFSTKDTTIPYSLKPIFYTLEQTHGKRQSNDLTEWATQGVLLLNSSLTVPEGAANGHRDLGWRNLCRQILVKLSKKDQHIVLVAFGKYAHNIINQLPNTNFCIFQMPHPAYINGGGKYIENSELFKRIDDC